MQVIAWDRKRPRLTAPMGPDAVVVLPASPELAWHVQVRWRHRVCSVEQGKAAENLIAHRSQTCRAGGLCRRLITRRDV